MSNTSFPGPNCRRERAKLSERTAISIAFSLQHLEELATFALDMRKFVYILVTVLLVLTACTGRRDQNMMLMKRAERQMKTDAQSAMHIIDSIPDTILSKGFVPEYHNSRCMQVFRYNKAAISLKEGKWGDAKDWLRLIIVQEESTNGKRQAIDFFEKLVLLMNKPKDAVNEKDSLKNSLISQLLSTDGSIQHTAAYDYSSAIKEATIHSPIYWSAIIFLIICLSLLLFIQQKENKAKAISLYQDKITQLNKDAERMKNSTSEKLGIGKQIYEAVTSGGTMKNISIENEHCFVDYYAFLFPEEYATITRPYNNLSLRHTTYLILLQMGFNDADIKTILFVKPSTIRNYRLRISKTKKQDI